MRIAGLVIVLLIILTVPTGWTSAQAPAAAPRYFIAYLSGDEEVPRATTRATGLAVFELNPARTALQYWLTLVTIENLLMAHIHIAAAGQNGPVVVWLYPSAPPPRLISGITSSDIASGTITAANFDGPLARQPFSALVTALDAGNAYVNAHTSRLPGGEIRGQIR